MSGFEAYEKTLILAGAKRGKEDEHGFTREYSLDSFGTEVRFKIFKNLVNAYIGDVQVIAYELTINGCFPNRYKTNLNMRTDGQTVCAIPLEKYPNR